ncbi:MAG: hypothetical protein WCT34_05555 [Patescibacteria group bacterium]
MLREISNLFLKIMLDGGALVEMGGVMAQKDIKPSAPNFTHLKELKGKVTNPFYTGEKTILKQKADTGSLFIEDLDAIVDQVSKHGIIVTSTGEYANAGINEVGEYSINLPKKIHPIVKLEELIHFEQDMDAINSGITLDQINQIPLEVRCLYEIQAAELALKHMDLWGVEDRMVRLEDEVNIAESKRQLKLMGLKIPKKIIDPWRTFPKKK